MHHDHHLHAHGRLCWHSHVRDQPLVLVPVPEPVKALVLAQVLGLGRVWELGLVPVPELVPALALVLLLEQELGLERVLALELELELELERRLGMEVQLRMELAQELVRGPGLARELVAVSEEEPELGL